jgi:hypothetical protein
MESGATEQKQSQKRRERRYNASLPWAFSDAVKLTGVDHVRPQLRIKRYTNFMRFRKSREWQQLAHSRRAAQSRRHGSYRMYYGPNVVLDVIDRRAEAAAVSAMASGSQHRTIKAMSHRMACSESTPESISSATTGSVPNSWKRDLRRF